MENKWNIIARNLQRSKDKNVSEDTFQDTIECQLQLLGWYEGVENKPTIPVGASKSLIPDIILNKNGHRVLPIEIKRPNINISVRHSSQLLSYMRILRLNVGLYIGEKIQLFYDSPEDENDAFCVLSIEYDENASIGKKFCQLLSFDNFDLCQLKRFCIEQMRFLRARNNFKNRILEFVSSQNLAQNITYLLKEQFLSEGFDESVIDLELKKLDIDIRYGEQNSIDDKKAKIKSDSIRNDTETNCKSPHTININSIFSIINKNGVNANAIYLGNNDLKVLEGSIFIANPKSSFKYYDILREVIRISEKISEDHYRLKRDYVFHSPSTASQVMTGTSTNGWIVWKTSEGKTLDEIVRKK